MTPFIDLPVDGFTLYTSFTWPASITMERRWLQNERVNALRQSSMYVFRARVGRPQRNVQVSSVIGQVRASAGSWLWAVSPSATPRVRFWDSSNTSWTQGIPASGPLPFRSYRNGATNFQGSLAPYVLLDEPWFLPDGIINWEQHGYATGVGVIGAYTPVCFYMAEPRNEVRGEILAACADQKAVSF
jgi:hypothetical protein